MNMIGRERRLRVTNSAVCIYNCSDLGFKNYTFQFFVPYVLSVETATNSLI
jgi:hypothetical protein